MEKNYVIYKIVCIDKTLDFIYIGSTSNLTSRKWDHKKRLTQSYRTGYNLKLYETMREYGGWDHFEFHPIEELVGVSKLQARIREQYWIDYYKPNLNSANAYTVRKEYMVIYNQTEGGKLSKLKTLEKRYEKYRKDRTDCECGSNIRTIDLQRHLESEKHKSYLNLSLHNHLDLY
jgi:hypothetical protein